MIDQIAFFVRNIGIAVLPDPYIINIIGNVRKTDVNIYLYTGSVFFLNLLVNGYNPWIISSNKDSTYGLVIRSLPSSSSISVL